MRRRSFLCGFPVLVVLCLLLSAPFASAADSTNLKTLTPDELVKLLNSSAKSPKPLLFQVGSHMLYVQAHIPGSEYIGAGNSPEGLHRLNERVSKLPKKTAIILYCGCCPWSHCPNVNPAYEALEKMGFTNVKVLYLANNFGTDWVDKGYPWRRGNSSVGKIVKRIVIIFVVAGMFVLGWLSLRRQPGHQQGASALRPAPEFSLTDLSGHPLRLSDYRGKVVILDFWATWCEPCKEEIPYFIDLQNKYSGLQVLGISMDDSEPPVREFQQKFKMNYPVALGTPKLADHYGGVLGLPITFVIDRSGNIAKRYIGATDVSVIEAEIKKLLAS